MKGPARLRFLGVEREIAHPSDWNHSQWPKLWLYNAHYFDDLVAMDSPSRAEWHRGLISRWIAENPPGAGNGWEPYPTSLRVVNWVKWALAGERLSLDAQHSLAVQVRSLRKRLEIHLLGNHLWANAKALIFAGAFFEGPEADGWRSKGLNLLRRELTEQILPDGGHFERSPMYHAILLEDVLDLVQLSHRYPELFDQADVARWEQTASKMHRWLTVMSHPDGGISFFNDAALEIAPTLQELTEYARMVDVSTSASTPEDVEHLSASGYFRLTSGPAVLLADAAEIGPDYLPGHAHADTLSFELSLGGERLFVNSGTSTYEANEERLRQRGTAAHNTVQVNQADSSEVWSSFRVARRARPLDRVLDRHKDELVLRAAHDGYRRLPGRPLHRRSWRLCPTRLTIVDTIEGHFEHGVARFRLHPRWKACVQTDERGSIESTDRRLGWAANHAKNIRVVPGMWHPRFGESQPCLVIEADFASPRLEMTFFWE